MLMILQQGAQWFAMGRQLLDVYPVFSQSIKEAGEYLRSLGCEWVPIGMRRISQYKGDTVANIRQMS